MGYGWKSMKQVCPKALKQGEELCCQEGGGWKEIWRRQFFFFLEWKQNSPSLQILGSLNSCVRFKEIAKRYQSSLIVPQKYYLFSRNQLIPQRKQQWLKMVRGNKTILPLHQGLLRRQLASQNSATSVSFTGIRSVRRHFCLRNHYLHQSISFYQRKEEMCQSHA